MRRATVIATCLVNSDMVQEIEDAKQAVLSVFNEECPDEDFDEWNRDIGEDAAEHIISTVGRAMTINVAKFIDDLRQY